MICFYVTVAAIMWSFIFSSYLPKYVFARLYFAFHKVRKYEYSVLDDIKPLATDVNAIDCHSFHINGSGGFTLWFSFARRHDENVELHVCVNCFDI